MTKVIMLDFEERMRFASWLEQEAHSNGEMAKQLKKIGAHGGLISKAMVDEAAAFMLVAKKLRSIEEMTIS